MSSMPSVDAANVESANWIPDVNRYGLPKPPAWFLKVLWDQDAALVILPSRQGQKYIIARRRERSRVIASIVYQQMNEQVHKRVPYSDADMLESRKLVKVDSIQSITGNVFNASWMTSCPEILKELRDRDMWAAGGAEKYIEKIEQAERDEEIRKRKTLEDNLEHRAADAWRSYQARTGQRTKLPGDQFRSSPKVKIVQVGTL